MKTALTVILLISSACALVAQGPPETTDPALDGVLDRVRQAAQTSNDDVARLRIDKWKTDFDQKVEMQKIAESVRRNVTIAVPDLLKGVQSSHGSVSTTFKLYHNLNVLYEYLNVLTESAATFGKEEEYTPLSRDAAQLDAARQQLSSYIEQAATTLEVKAARPVPTPVPVVEPPKKIVVDDAPTKSVTTKKKKTSAPRPQPSSTPN
jgi:hypothetical protein